MSDKDFNAPPFLPPVIQHLSLYVNRAKTRFKPYEKNGPSMWAVHFAESSVAPQSDLSLMDVHNGKCQLQLGLSDVSHEAITQAVLMKEADVEYRHLSAMAMAWRIEATERHTKFLHMLLEQAADKYVTTPSEKLEALVPALASCSKEELGDDRDFSVAAYSHDAASFAAADEQLSHMEMFAQDHYGSGPGSNLDEDCKQEEPELPPESDSSSMGSDQAPVALP
ncbi:hypothetical protein BDR05DRAFT_1003427 [Suillus weaverae]|nr:hypothetical protein BDR05DRAFT_1003427 [Suillus weaverae]